MQELLNAEKAAKGRCHKTMYRFSLIYLMSSIGGRYMEVLLDILWSRQSGELKERGMAR